MRKLLVVAELSKGAIDDCTWELGNAARALAGADSDARVGVALLGEGVGALAEPLAKRFDDVYLFDSSLLAMPDGEIYGALLTSLIQREQPVVTMIPHTNNGMDLAPKLSAGIGSPLLPDCISLEFDGDQLTGVRTIYAGKVHARIRAAASTAGTMATVRPGAFPGENDGADVGGAIHQESVPDSIDVRRKTIQTIAPEPGAVDISQAEKLVAVGRGIEEEENLEMIRSLAEALGAEVACSRPVVDKNWLEKTRQVGTSGVAVKPKIYLAIGISGSFQHIGGIKGGPFIAAINKDPRAPIFGTADVGIVGDLFEIVPVLEEKIREAKG